MCLYAPPVLREQAREQTTPPLLGQGLHCYAPFCATARSSRAACGCYSLALVLAALRCGRAGYTRLN